MKQVICSGMICCCLMMGLRAGCQMQELEELALDIEKLAQFKQILSDLKKGYQVLEGGYTTIKNLSQGNFDLHKAFLDGLLAVSPAVKNYFRVGAIVDGQLQMIKAYKTAMTRFRGQGEFTTGELSYIAGVYDNLLKESVQGLDDLTAVLTPSRLRMSDEERLQAIDRLYVSMQNRLAFLQHFNNSAAVLALQRFREQQDIHTMRLFHGITK